MGDVNLNLGKEQIFNIIDRNKNGKIDNGDNLQMAKFFGLKDGDSQINEKKVNNFQSKASVFSAYVNNSLKVQNSSGNVIAQVNGNDNNLSIELPENKNETFNVNPQEGFSPEAQLALMQKGLDPAAIAGAGFGEIQQLVADDGSTQLILKSQDGYNLKISDVQDEKNVKISRDENNNLVLNGVYGKLDIQPGSARSHEVILSNVYNNDGATLEIVNKSGAPLTKTYVANNGELSNDAKKAVGMTNFPVTQLVNGGFTQVSITETPNVGRGTSSSMINLSSAKHGYTVQTNAYGQQPEDMRLHYDSVHNSLDLVKLQNANVDITDSDASEYNVGYSGLSHVVVTNKTNKPTHIEDTLLQTKNGPTHAKSSAFEYITYNNFDTWHREQKPGSTDLPPVTLHPGRFSSEATIDRNNNKVLTKNSLHFLNRSGISQVTMYDIIQEDQAKVNTSGYDNALKIDRSDGYYNARAVYYKDQSLEVNNSNGNIIMQVNGDRNIVHISPAKNNKMSNDAISKLQNDFGIDANMFNNVGFNDVTFVCGNDGKVTDIVMKNTDGAELTMPADKAMLLSKQMNITKENGEYKLSNITGSMRGSGMKIFADSNVSMDIYDDDPANGRLACRKHDELTGRDAYRLSYSVPDGMQANVVSVNSNGQIRAIKKPVPQDQKGQVDPLNYSTINILYIAAQSAGTSSTYKIN